VGPRAERQNALKNLTSRDLAIKLGENERYFANKLSRGAFTAAFVLQCLDAIDSRQLQLG
jgi:hypothetical protein